MKKVIILGGAGFIGLNIAKYLIANKNIKLLSLIISQEEKWIPI